MSIAMKVSFSNKPAVTTSAPYSNQRKLYGMEHFFTSPFAKRVPAMAQASARRRNPTTEQAEEGRACTSVPVVQMHA